MFDILTIAAVADELTNTVMDGRIQRVGMISKLAVGFEVYAEQRRRYLVASAENDDARVLLLDREPSFDSQLVTPLLLLLRKYARGGIIVGIEQPPLDRIVRLSIAKRLGPHNEPAVGDPSAIPEIVDEDEDPDGMEGATFIHLAIEIMGRHSNLILVDDDSKVMEAAKRVTREMSRVRPIAPRVLYTDVPAGDRTDPRRVSTADMAMLLGGERPDSRIAAVLPRRMRAVSPQMAREIALRALGEQDALVRDASGEGHAAIARETRRLFEPLLTSAWEPQVYRNADGEIVEFSATPMGHLAREFTAEAVASISRAAEMAATEQFHAAPGKHSQRRLRLEQSIVDARAKIEAKLTSLRAEVAKGDEIERLRRWGELIYGYLWMIVPGQSVLEVDEERVPLDPALSAKENAQRYFERYRKAQGAVEHVPELIEKATTEVEYLDQLLTLARQSESFAELEEVSLEFDAFQRAKGGAKERGKQKPRSSSPRRTKPMAMVRGNAIYVGRSGAENDRIAFTIAGPNDSWLHARGVPGSHVIVRWSDPNVEEDEPTLAVAAGLAAYYSASRESGSVEVDITRRRHVRKIKGVGPGLVTYRNERTIRVEPRDATERA